MKSSAEKNDGIRLLSLISRVHGSPISFPCGGSLQTRCLPANCELEFPSKELSELVGRCVPAVAQAVRTPAGGQFARSVAPGGRRVSGLHVLFFRSE